MIDQQGENRPDIKEKKQQTNDDIDLVLAVVPREVRSDPRSNFEYSEKVAKAKKRLEEEGIVVDKYIKATDPSLPPEERNLLFGQNKANLREIVRKMKGDENLNEEESEIAKKVNINSGNLIRSSERQNSPGTKGSPSEQAEAEIRDRMIKIGAIDNLTFRNRQLGKLAEEAYKSGMSPKLVSEISDLADKSRFEKTTVDAKKNAEVPEFKEFTDNETWVKWGRERLALYLNPDSEQSMKLKGQSPFAIEKESLYGKTWQDGLLYMPVEVKTQMELEYKTAAELRQMFLVWKKNHENLDNMANEKSSDVPSNELIGRLLNGLSGENGVAGEGSEKVAEAIALYARMSLVAEGNNSRLEYGDGGNGVDVEVPSIFNNVLSTEEVIEIRKRVADKCGGEYYEALGLILAKMMGIAAKGSTSLKANIDNSDCLGKLIYTRKWNFEGEDTDRWLPLEMAKDDRGNFLFRMRNEGSDDYGNDTDSPIKLAVDAFGLQTSGKPEKKGYYLTITDDGKYKMHKDLPEGETDSGAILGSLLLEAKLNGVDWKGSSFELLTNLKKRNGKSLDIYAMLREPMDSKASFVPEELGKKRELINSALGQYGDRTKFWVGYLYTESWIRRHSLDWIKARLGNRSEDVDKQIWSKDKIKIYIDSSRRAGLIDKTLSGILNKHYKTGLISFV